MDEYNSGMDPEVRHYFKKIINSISFGVMWLMIVVAGGLFFDLGGLKNGVEWYNIIFYVLAIVSLALLLFYYYRTWTKK
jgi:hypothetical protein